MKLGIAVLALLFLPYTVQAQECRLIKLATFDLRAAVGNRPVIPISVNGSEHKFLFDTGGAFSAVTTTVAEQLGLKPQTIGNMHIYNMRGGKISEYVTVKELKIGLSTAKNRQLMVMPAGDLPPGIDGIISPDILVNFDLDFDFPDHTLNLMSREHCKGRVVYWTNEYADIPFKLSSISHEIEIPVVLDQVKMQAIIDTGADSTVLSPLIARNKFNLSENSPDIEKPIGTNSPIKFRHRFQEMDFGGVGVKNTMIAVRSDALERTARKDQTGPMDLRMSGVTAPDLLIGMNILSRLHVYIAYKENKLYVSNAKNVSADTVATQAQPEP